MSRIFDHERRRSQPMTRRKLIQLGAAGTFGLTLPKLLQAESTATRRASAKSCIFIILSGGLSHIDS